MSDAGGLFRPQEGIGVHGADVPGPPWILGRRGAPREAPENTLASLRRAIELGLDGFSYELRACLSGELVLLADETLDRTTDRSGRLSTRTLPELAAADAGGWFGKRFAGEPLALLEETFELLGNRAGTHPQHLIELPEAGLVHELASALAGGGRRLSVRVASARSAVCAEARAAGLEAMWLVPEASERARELAREERLAAVGAPSGWLAGESWPCERWAVDVDAPEGLLAALRAGVNGLSTTEPRRALALRAACHLAGGVPERYPLRAPVLAMEPGLQLDGPGEWCGRWPLEVELENPFPFPVRAALELVVRRGAFEARGLPAGARLEPGQAARFPFELAGGSWRLGGDPLLAAHLFWDPGPGRPGEHLVLDAPLERRRTLRLDEGARRLELVRERPADPPATVTARRAGRDLLISLEDPGDLDQARVLVHLDGVLHTGGRGVRARLPEGAHLCRDGVPFSVGLTGLRPPAGRRPARGDEAGRPAAERAAPERAVRRWAGGLPDPIDAGPPGRLVVRGES